MVTTELALPDHTARRGVFTFAQTYLEGLPSEAGCRKHRNKKD